ncbi:MAG: hypothetical protein A2Y14_00565 [Verrucomicrobia bacterium GWF2_51_19]|nr:MAG: hypothetical protein A2Y14_00565 [Verrucomicrobia bacterium GWF2_51_19]HCJ12422.1 hypothetical protein [Opitutae bacterium]
MLKWSLLFFCTFAWAADKLALPDLVDLALKNSPDVRISSEAIELKRAQKGISEKALYPTVSVTGQVQQQQTGATSSTPTVVTKSAYPSVDITYTLFHFGADKAKADAAYQRLIAAQYAHNRELQTIVYQVQTAYFDFFTAQETVCANMSNYEDATSAYEAAKSRFESGLDKKQSLLQAKAEMLKALFELERVRANVEAQRANLAAVVGVPICSAIDIALPEEPKTFFQELKLEALLADVVKERADVRAERETFMAYEKDVYSSQRAFWPQLVLGLSADLIKTQHQSGLKRDYLGYIAIKWDIFNGFGDFYAILQAKTQREQQRQAVRAKELDVMKEVWSTYFTVKSAFRQREAAQSLFGASQESFEATQEGYHSGVNSLLDLLNAQKTLASGRLNLVSADNTLMVALAEFAYVTARERR